MNGPDLTLGELLDLELRLAADTALGQGERRERDRAAAGVIRDGLAQHPKLTRAQLLRLWLRARAEPAAAPGAPAGLTPGRKLDRLLTGSALALAAAGLLVGGSTAAALLRYDGTHPVNVISVLAVFVGVQLLTLLFLLSQALPGGVLRPRPGQAPPSWIHRILRAFLHDRLRTAPAFSRLFAPCEAWRLLVLTQLFGVCFNVAALAVTVGTVLVSDLAFAWGTTLAATPEALHRLVSILAAPWAAWLPDAAPTLELVRATQYYRLKAEGEAGFVQPGAAAFYGAWWPFLTASLAVYGLLPRGLLLAFARWRDRSARARAVNESLEATLLAERLNSFVFEDRSPAAAEVAPSAPKNAGRTGQCGVVLWRDLPFDEGAVRALVRTASGTEPVFVRKAGGTALDLDAVAAGQAFAPAGAAAAVIVVDVFAALDKALIRFIRGLRATLGPRAPILILPVSGGGDVPEAPASGLDQDKVGIWRRAVRDLDDAAVALVEAP